MRQAASEFDIPRRVEAVPVCVEPLVTSRGSGISSCSVPGYCYITTAIPVLTK